MAACTFFGHRSCSDQIRPQLRAILIDLIERRGVNFFYIGTQGQFDALALSEVKALRRQYPNIDYSVVLAYMPRAQDRSLGHFCYPEGLECAPPRFAVDRRNKWMLRQADYVVTYVTHSWGGAAKFYGLANRMGKIVFNIDIE